MYKNIFLEFLKLGLFAFGGPAGHIALMHKRFVTELKWLDDTHFLDLVSLSSLIPGPSSTELTLLIGRHKGGILGLYIAGISFIFPALVMVLILSFFYVEYGSLGFIQSIFYYILPVMVAIIIFATFSLSKQALKSFLDIIVLLVSIILSFFMTQVFVFVVIGWIGFFIHTIKTKRGHVYEGITLLALLFIFFNIGATLYGSGYVLISYLQTAFIDTNLLTPETLVDAIAVGQMTPGPVFTTAAFIGYVLTENVGIGILSAIAIFLPGFVLITVFYQGFEKLRLKQTTKHVLHALHLAAIGLLLRVIFDYSLVMKDDIFLVIISALGVVGLLSKKISPTILIASAIIFGLVIHFT